MSRVVEILFVSRTPTTAPISSSLGMLVAMLGATLVFAATMLVNRESSLYLYLVFTTAPYAFSDALTNVCSDMSSTGVVFSCRHLGICSHFKSCSSLNQSCAVLTSESSISSSHSKPAVYMVCSNIFARILNGASRPVGSNSVAIFFKKLRLVYFMSLSGAFSLNVNTSWSAITKLRVF